MTTVLPKVEMSTFADTKRCSYCSQDLPRERFTKHKRYSDGLQSYCKDCMKQYRRDNAERMNSNRSAYLEKNKDHLNNKLYLRKYGITYQMYLDLLEQQGNTCAICSSASGGFKNGSELAFSVDHDHNCCPGKTSCGNCVRGLLCNKCNLAIGLLNDDVETLTAAIQYLQENN